MSEYILHKDLKLKNSMDLKDILETPDDNDTGYLLEVDLHVPVKLHDKFQEFPPAPETLTPDIDWLTPYQQEIGFKTDIINNGVVHGANRLVPHLYDHKQYVIHYKTLKYIVGLGFRS